MNILVTDRLMAVTTQMCTLTNIKEPQNHLPSQLTTSLPAHLVLDGDWDKADTQGRFIYFT